MKNLVREIVRLLESGESVVLSTVVESCGSTPRSSGAKMAVRRDGRIEGTVGGGIVEAKACRCAAGMLEKEGDSAILSHMSLTSDLAAGTDMICGGDLTLLMETVAPASEAANCYQALDGLLRRGRKAVMFTAFESCGADDDTVRVKGRSVGESIGDMPDTYGLDAGKAAELFDRALSMGGASQEVGGVHVFAEAFIPPAPLYLFGAGHVSRATARIAATVNFRVVVVDDRGDFANEERFPDADEVVVLDSFDDSFGDREIDPGDYIVIFTRGHVHDKTVLGQALKTPAHYVGMIGSKRKRNAIYEALLEEGISQQDIDRTYSPIGLTIGAQTPEEIALSIVSELVAVRAGVRDSVC